MWLAEQLHDLHPAILSRGYGRNTTGYRQVHAYDTAADVGDEPLLYAHSLQNVPVRVCENRLVGVQRIADEATSNFVLLDDAMQHRRLQGNFILGLVHADRMPYDDDYLPGGRLRDHIIRLRQADAILLTHVKSDDIDHPPIRAKINRLKHHLGLPEETPVYVSRTSYGSLKLLGLKGNVHPKRIIAVCGIANPDQFLHHLDSEFSVVERFVYSDHHPFTSKIVQTWMRSLATTQADAIVTTEKDWMRIKTIEATHELPIFALPLRVTVHNSDELLNAIRTRLNRA